jgi:hypothetical protein
MITNNNTLFIKYSELEGVINNDNPDKSSSNLEYNSGILNMVNKVINKYNGHFT